MTHSDLVRMYNQQVDRDVIEFVLVEDEGEVGEGNMFVQGWFNPNFFEDCEDTPVRVEIIVERADADVEREAIEAIDKEVVKTVNHEMIHYQQHQEGRFIENWEGSYEENENEIEAYAGEHEGNHFNKQ